MASNNNNNLQLEQVNTDIITLTRFLTEEQAKHAEATGDFTWAAPSALQIEEILTACLDCSAMPSNSRSNR